MQQKPFLHFHILQVGGEFPPDTVTAQILYWS